MRNRQCLCGFAQVAHRHEVTVLLTERDSCPNRPLI
jgi:hypothetical protein